MNSKIYKLATLFFLVTIASIYYSCKKEDKKDDITPTPTTTSDKDATVAEDNATAESEYEEVFNYVDEESSNEANNLRTTAGDTVKKTVYNSLKRPCVDSITFEKTGTVLTGFKVKIVFYFNETRTCGNGAQRKGKIITMLNGLYKAPGSTATVTFEDFYVHRTNMEAGKWIHIEGTKTITLQEFSMTPKSRKVNVKVEGAKLTFPDSSLISWESNRTRTVTVVDTPSLLKTVKFWGTASGTTRKGKKYSAEITEANAMIHKSDCKWLVSGKLTLTRTDSTTIKSRTVDYGDGTCDDKATVMLASGDTVQIRLR